MSSSDDLWLDAEGCCWWRLEVNVLIRHSGARRNPSAHSRNGANQNGYPKFTNQVQHLLDKVLPWDKSMNSFRLKSAVHFPDLAKPGKQSAKSRQLWIARHRL